MVTPELALCGYPPEDLLLREDFLAACDQALLDLAARAGKRHAGGRAPARQRRQALQLRVRDQGRQGGRRLRQAALAELHRVRRGALLRAGGHAVRVRHRRRQLRRQHLRGCLGRARAGHCARPWRTQRRARRHQYLRRLVERHGAARRARGRRQCPAGAECFPLPYGQAARTLRRDARARGGEPAWRWFTPTWSAGRTSWCSTAVRSC